MHIDKKKVIDEFKSYTDNYDSNNVKIKLKIDHTYRVADNCEEIARSEGLASDDQMLAWLIGMLHDIGRFEQLRQFNTFSDAMSVDHAAFGADILFVEGKIRDYIEALSEDKLIETAIRQHSLYRIDETMSDRTKMFCNILRDADKIDILNVFTEVPIEEVYNTTREELYSSKVSPEVMASFSEHHATLRHLKKTPVDFLVAHISLVFELVYNSSKSILDRQGSLDKLLAFESKNEETKNQFKCIREEIKLYKKMS